MMMTTKRVAGAVAAVKECMTVQLVVSATEVALSLLRKGMMTMSKEAMKLALEALRLCTNAGMIPMYLKANQTAITSLRQAIAELESQEPMAWYCCFQGQEEGEFFLFGSPNSERYPSQYKTPLYEHLPQRTWVGLTDEEVRQMCGSVPSMKEAVREAEAKLKEKNGA
jgi:hypothetical protein